jgi:hypothetical protein
MFCIENNKFKKCSVLKTKSDKNVLYWKQYETLSVNVWKQKE